MEAGAARDVAPRRPRASIQAFAMAACVTLLAVGIALRHGALGIPRNDDWDYYRSAFTLAADGRIVIGSATAMLVGQLLAAQPVIAIFGPSVAALQVWAASLGVVALLATYSALRRLLQPIWAYAILGTVALGPVFLTLAPSFMTDVPAYAAGALCLAVGARALQATRLRIGSTALALAFGLLALSIREYWVAAPAAVCVMAALSSRRSTGGRWPGRSVLLLTIVTAGLAALLLSWRLQQSSGAGAHSIGMPTLGALAAAIALLVTIAALAAPVLLVVSPVKLSRDLPGRTGPLLAMLVIAVGILCLLVRGRQGVLLGNYLTPSGAYSATLVGTAPVVIPGWAWAAVQLVSIWAAVVAALAVAGAVIARRRGPAPAWLPAEGPSGVLETFVILGAGVHLAALVLLDAPVFDRSVLPVVPFAAALVIRHALAQGAIVRSPTATFVPLLSIWALLGFHIADASATYDSARWSLASRVRDLGARSESIDGGYEWFGFHQPGEVVLPARPAQPWWTGLFGEVRVCMTSRYAEGASLPGNVVVEIRERSSLGTEYRLESAPGPDTCRKG